MVGVERNLSAASNQAGRPPCPRPPHSSSSRRLVAGGLDGLVRTFAMGQIEDRLDGVNGGWIEGHVRPQIERQLSALCRRLDGDHACAHCYGELGGRKW